MGRVPSEPARTGPHSAGPNGNPTVAELAVSWLDSHRFRALKPATQHTYQLLLNLFLAEYGAWPVAGFEPRHILALLDDRCDAPAQANALLTVLRRLFQHGFERGWRPDNPTRDVERLRYVKQPYPTWSEANIARFELRWPLGSRARLAFALLLYTGQRRGDVVRMAPRHVCDGAIELRQAKTGTRLWIPLHDALKAAIVAHGSPAGGHLAFLVTKAGKPFTPVGFYNMFKGCAAKAGLPKGLSPHGLRKAAARRLAEAGCTPHQIAAITGHQSLAEVERYTKEVNQRRLARDAVNCLGPQPGSDP